MNYYYDTEFIEGKQKSVFPLSLFKSETKPTIDLISIGIVAEDCREYYAISKDFNLKEAWNRFNIKESHFSNKDGEYPYKEYWIRENVLRSIYNDLHKKSLLNHHYVREHYYIIGTGFSYRHLKSLLEWYGKTNKEIALEVQEFIYQFAIKGYDENDIQKATTKKLIENFKGKINLYGYYSAYDHVVFCWLFGKMIDLPKGFPMYTRDLKQMSDEKIFEVYSDIEMWGKDIKSHKNYPIQEPGKAHNAIEDARWNKQLHEFLKSL